MRVDFEKLVARRALVRHHEKAVVEHVDQTEDGVASLHHHHRRAALFTIDKEQLGLAPAFRNLDGKKAAAGRKHDAGPGRKAQPIAEDFRVGRRVSAETMKVHVAMVVLLARGNAAGCRVAGVVEALAGRQPRQRARARVRNRVRKVASGRNVTNPQCRVLVARSGNSVGKQRAVLGWIPPVKRRRAVGGQCVHIEKRAVFPAVALAHVKDRLVLLAFPSRVEKPKLLALASRNRRTQRTGFVPLPQTIAKPRPAGHLVQRFAQVLVLCRGPGLHLGRVTVFEPAIGVGNWNAVDGFHHLVDTSRRERSRKNHRHKYKHLPDLLIMPSQP